MTSLEHPNDAIINWIRSHKKLIYLTADLSIIILTLTSIHILRLTGWLTQNA